MKRIAIYATVAILSFLIFVIAFAPAATVWVLFKDQAMRRLPDLSVLTIDGTIWNGDADFRYRGFPPTTLTWGISLLSLARATLESDANIDGQSHHVDAHVVVTRDLAQVHIEGFVGSMFINPQSGRFGLTFPGQLEVTNIDIQTDLHWITAAEGDLHWAGGDILWDSPDGLQTIVLPPLTGTLYFANDTLLLDIDHGVEKLITVKVHRNGWAEVNILARMLDLAGVPYASSLRQDEPAVIFEERLF